MNGIDCFSKSEVLLHIKNAAGSIPIVAFVLRTDHLKQTVSDSLLISDTRNSSFRIQPIRWMVCSRRSRIGLLYAEDFSEFEDTKLLPKFFQETRAEPPKSSIKPQYLILLLLLQIGVMVT